MMGAARLFRSPFAVPKIYRDPFRREPAWTQVHPHWLWSALGQRHFFRLVQPRLPTQLWPRAVVDAVVDAVADLLIADVRAKRPRGEAS